MRRTVSVLIVCLMICLVFSSARNVRAATPEQIQSEIDELKAQERELEKELAELESKIAENSDKVQSLVAQKGVVDQQIVLLHEQQENNQEQIRSCSEMIAQSQKELETAEEKLTQLQEKSRKRIRAMEEQGKLSYWSVLIRSKSFADFLDRLEMIQEIAAGDRRRLEELELAAQAVENTKRTLLAEQETLEKMRQQLQETESDLEEKQLQNQKILEDLVAKGDEYEALLQESENKQDDLMKELAQKESAYEESVKQGSEISSPVETPNSGKWLVPVPYYTLTSPFGNRFHPILNIWRMHNGVDLACAAETPIYASRSGVVAVASYQADGAGNYVQLDHGDGYRSIYMHMTRYIVSPGQQVAAGETIGFVGNTGLSKGNHLHFGISYNGTYVNPMEYIS